MALTTASKITLVALVNELGPTINHTAHTKAELVVEIWQRIAMIKQTIALQDAEIIGLRMRFFELEAGATAPAAIHAPIRAISADPSGGRRYGIGSTPSCPPDSSRNIRLSDGAPGRSAAPLSPPLRAPAAVSSRSPALGCSAPWQGTQLRVSRGFTSVR